MIPRKIKFWWQRRTRGFDDTELWSLDHTILQFALPRLKAFVESDRMGYPAGLLDSDTLTHEEWWEKQNLWQTDPEQAEKNQKAEIAHWEDILKKMLRGVELYIENGDSCFAIDDPRNEECREGLELFHEYFQCLWD